MNRLGFVRSLLTVSGVMLVGSLLATSCLTPDFDFDGTSGGGLAGAANQPGDHCTNQRTDADETDVDCGGDNCPACAVGRSCLVNSDCTNGSCIGGICRDASCTDGVRNFGETDTDCGGENCPPCAEGDRCLESRDCESNVCTGQVCQAPSCSDRVQNGDETDRDCGGSCDGCEPGRACEVDTDCKAPPSELATGVACVDGTCVLECGLGRADCNRRSEDGCEVELNTDLEHCGECGATCAPANATGGVCQSGVCLIDFQNGGCVEGYEDCDGDPANGCEAHLNTSTAHCGGCNAPCSSSNGTASCSGGECAIECDSGYADCDDDARSNGCEINLQTNVSHCNTCDNACPAGTGSQSRYCAEGVCGFTDCPEGMGDCNGNGMCTDALSTSSNCGACGNSCTAQNGTATCVDLGSYQCAVSACTSPWQDCNSLYHDGCETNVLSSVAHCGACLGSGGVNCETSKDATVNGVSCNMGACTILSCSSSNRRDCDGVWGNGCEININTSSSNCGSCGNNCNNTKHTTVNAVTCSSGSCAVVSCNSSSRADCDGDWGNGCEINMNTSTTHCGGCTSGPTTTWNGGVNCNTTKHTSVNEVTCSSGSCQVSTCNSSNTRDCDGVWSNGCETNITSTVAHCGGCNQPCASKANATASCSSSSCSWTCNDGWVDTNGDLQSPSSDGCETRAIQRVNASTPVSAGSGTLSFTHTLQTPQASGANLRMVIVGIMCRANNLADCTPSNPTYGGQQLTRLGEGSPMNNNAVAQIYYVLDAALGSTGTKTVNLGSVPSSGALTAQAVEYTGVHQTTPFSAHDYGTRGNCDSTSPDAFHDFSSLVGGSWVYAVSGGFGGEGTATAELPLMTLESHYANGLLFGSGDAGPVSGNLRAQFELTGCNASVLFAGALQPAN